MAVPDRLLPDRARGWLQGFAKTLAALLVAIAFMLCAPGAAQAEEGDPRVPEALVSCVRGVLASYDAPDAEGFYASENVLLDDGASVWLAFDMYRAGATSGASAFLERLEAYVTESYAGDEAGLDSTSPTTWARTALVVTTMGADPAAFGQDAAGKPANLLADGLYNWSYTPDLGDQGANAYIYALQALDALNAGTPAYAQYSARDMLAGLLACQTPDGSFALAPGAATGSVDMTGMALAALAGCRSEESAVEAIDKAIVYLSSEQLADGGFAAEGMQTCESCAMVLVGLSACGVDGATDERFVKEGGSLLDAVLSYQKADGTFSHDKDGLETPRVQDLPTEQACRALLAYSELAQGGDGDIYTSDIPITVAGIGANGPSVSTGLAQEPSAPASFDATVPLTSMGMGAVAGFAVVLAIWGIRKIRRKARR